jgi:hypothetical protein
MESLPTKTVGEDGDCFEYFIHVLQFEIIRNIVRLLINTNED